MVAMRQSQFSTQGGPFGEGCPGGLSPPSPPFIQALAILPAPLGCSLEDADLPSSWDLRLGSFEGPADT